MGEKRKKLSALTGSVTPESVKIVAESVGLSDLSDATLMFIADEMTFRLRHTIQVCIVESLSGSDLCVICFSLC